MAISSASVTVNDSVVSLNEADERGGATLLVKNAGGGNAVADLGPSDVVLGAGFELGARETVEVHLEAGERLYAVSDVDGTTLKILRT